MVPKELTQKEIKERLRDEEEYDLTKLWLHPEAQRLDKDGVELPVWMWNELSRQADVFGCNRDDLIRIWLGERLRPRTVD
jgi:hypothetical protein